MYFLYYYVTPEAPETSDKVFIYKSDLLQDCLNKASLDKQTQFSVEMITPFGATVLV